MVSIRPMTLKDLLSVQNTNLLCLPENYHQKYFIFHLMSWPGISFVAEDTARSGGSSRSSRIVGYVMGKMEDDDPAAKPLPHGHITSLAVERNYRRRGIAQNLMEQTSRAMIQLFNATTLTLHVRASNRAAHALYATVLKFELVNREVGYYADGEDGLFMRRDLVHHALVNGISPAEKKSFFAGRSLEDLVFHNLEHQGCKSNAGGGGVCEVKAIQNGLDQLSIEDGKIGDGDGEVKTSDDAAAAAAEGSKIDDVNVAENSGSGPMATMAMATSSTASDSSVPRRVKTPRSPADAAAAARFKGRKEKLRKSRSSKANKENGAAAGKEQQDADATGLNIVKI